MTILVSPRVHDLGRFQGRRAVPRLPARCAAATSRVRAPVFAAIA